MLIVLITGSTLGALTRFFDNQENALTWFGSLAAPWVLVAFGIGAIVAGRERAILASAATMILGVIVYYAWMRFFEGGVNLSYFLSITTLWLLLAPVAGVVFGLAGAIWRGRANDWIPGSIAVGVIAGLIAGESAFMAMTSSALTAGELVILGGFLLTGLALPGVLLAGTRTRVAGYLVTVFFLFLGMATVPVIRGLIALFE